jgi:nitrite reductase/ring-hydroxylating ferredoxin subunit
MIVKLCEAPSLPEEGGLRAFRRGDTDVCVARANGLFAFENRCPHQAVSSDPCLILFEVRQFSSEVFIKLPDA